MSIKEVKAYLEYTALSTPRLKKGGSVWCKISWLHRKETRVIATHYPVSPDPGDLFTPAASRQLCRCRAGCSLPPFPRARRQGSKAKPLSRTPRGQSCILPRGSAPSSPALSYSSGCFAFRDILMLQAREVPHLHFRPTWFCILGAGNGLMYASASCLRLFLSM